MTAYGMARLSIWILIILIALPTLAQAQRKENGDNTTSSKDDHPAAGEHLELAAEVRLLNSRIEKLESVIEQQQRLLLEMQRRLDAGEAKAQPQPPSNAAAAEAVSNRLPASAEKPRNEKPGIGQTSSDDKSSGVSGWGKDHPFIRSSDGSFETQIGGYGQLDFRGYGSGDHPPNTFLLRRARIALEGKVDRYFDFRIEGDLADPATPLRDFYVDIHRIEEFRMRFGQFRVPFSQEEIRSDNIQDFVERSLVNNLVPSRSPGIGASGSLDNGVFEYQLGAWNGKGLLATNNNGTPEVALRLRFNPWKHSDTFLTRGLIFGGAVTQGRSAGGVSIRGLTESRSFTFFSPDTINGKYTRANAELTWMLGPAAIRAEYDQTNQRRDNLGSAGQNLPAVVSKGYAAQITYLLTGEEKPESAPLSPRRNLFGDSAGSEGFGAWEVKFRYSNLQIDDSTPKSNRAGTFYFGTNWYLNRFVRYVLDLGVERFRDPLRTPRPGDRNFFVVLSRVQVAF